MSSKTIGTIEKIARKQNGNGHNPQMSVKSAGAVPRTEPKTSESIMHKLKVGKDKSNATANVTATVLATQLISQRFNSGKMYAVNCDSCPIDCMIKKIKDAKVRSAAIRMRTDHIYEEGERIFQTNDDSNGIRFVCAGSVGIETSHRSGGELIVHTVMPGEPLGECAFFAQGQHYESAVALEKSRVCKFSYNDSEMIVALDLIAWADRIRSTVQAVISGRKHPDEITRFGKPLLGKFTKGLGRALRDQTKKTQRVVHEPAKDRIKRILKKNHHNLVVTMKKMLIAQMAHVEKETLSRQLKAWEDEGFIRREKDGRIMLLDKFDRFYMQEGSAKGHAQAMHKA
jgi:CRP-like cAMP-binding protein